MSSERAGLAGPVVIADEEPGSLLVTRRGRGVAGYAVGVLVIDTRYPLVPGNVANASTFDFPVLYEVLDISVDEILRAGPELVDRVIAGARRLEERGVRAIVGACGTLANYQDALTAAVDVPVFASILTQVPFLLRALPARRRLGVLAATDGLLTDSVRRQCGITDPSRLAVFGADQVPEFRRLLRGEPSFDHGRLEAELLEQMDRFAEQHPDLGALLIQCSDLPPYAAALQARLGLPVFDLPGLMRWVFESVVRRPYSGFL